MNRLTYFLLLRVIEVIGLLILKYIDAYNEENFRKIIITLAAVTALVLIATFSRYKKHDRYKLPLRWGFGLFLSFLVMVELCLFVAAPKGILTFGTTQWIIGGIEIVLGISLGFFKKFELL